MLVVPCRLSVTNSGKKSASFSLKTAADDDCVMVLGSVNMRRVPMSAGETKNFLFRLGVTSPGVYRCRGLALRMDPDGDAEQTRGDGFAPLQVSFVVNQAAEVK
jgi:hypothetical protein